MENQAFLSHSIRKLQTDLKKLFLAYQDPDSNLEVCNIRVTQSPSQLKREGVTTNFLVFTPFYTVWNHHNGFDAHIIITWKGIWGILLALFANLKPNAHKADKKMKKSFFQKWIRINYIVQFWFRTSEFFKSFHPNPYLISGIFLTWTFYVLW
jgi:hypothetical protein